MRGWRAILTIAALAAAAPAWAAEVSAREHVERVIDLLDLQHHRDSMVAGLPYGVRKVVELARALAAEPRPQVLIRTSAGDIRVELLPEELLRQLEIIQYTYQERLMTQL